MLVFPMPYRAEIIPHIAQIDAFGYEARIAPVVFGVSITMTTSRRTDLGALESTWLTLRIVQEGVMGGIEAFPSGESALHGYRYPMTESELLVENICKPERPFWKVVDVQGASVLQNRYRSIQNLA